MSELWLQIVGIGAEGLPSLSPAARGAVEAAEIVFGGRRHLAMLPRGRAERVEWPSPFDHLLNRLESCRGRRTVALVTGDPTWRSAGARIAAAFEEAVIHPQVSAYQLAAARMLWPLEDCACLTVHGRAGGARDVAALRPFVQPGARLIVLAADGGSAEAVGVALKDWGFGASPLRALWDLGAGTEGWQEAPAAAWASGRIERPGDLCTLAVECRAEPGARFVPALPGLPDDLFEGDGVMTKREVRAVTLARLAPARGALLWDVGCGCGSVAVEWMRAAPGARAVGIEPRADRRALAAANAARLGAPGLELREGTAPDAMSGLPAPDAVFLGGGVSDAAIDGAWAALSPGGRLVANAVTLRGEAALAAAQARLGGELTRIRIERAEPVGGAGGPLAWRPAMPVCQWSVTR